MTKLFFYDTETTGLPLFKEPSEHPDQPHIVQVAAALVDVDTRKIISSINLIIKPDGYEIPPEMTDIHGIDTAYASAYGVPLVVAMSAFFHLWDGLKRVAFNESFDARIIRIAQHKLGHAEKQLDEWKVSEKECAMKMAHKYTNLPRNKWPKLQEAHRHFFGSDFDNVHNAMADVEATIKVYFAVKDLEAV